MIQITLPPQLGFAIAIGVTLVVILFVALKMCCESDKITDAIFGTRIGKFTVGIVILVLTILFPLQWFGYFHFYVVLLLFASSLFIAAAIGLKARFIVLVIGMFGVIVGIYQIAFQTESLYNPEFMLVFMGGGVVLIILSICWISISLRDKNPPPEYPPWSEI